MASKGKNNAKTWQRISPSLDKVEAVVKKTKSSLGKSSMENEITTRNILLEEEINELRTVLRASGYLTTKKCAIVFSIYGEPLCHVLINLTANVSSKRDEYFAKALDINLQNIL